MVSSFEILVCFEFLLKKWIRNLLKIKTERTILEKIYVKIKASFIYFQSNGLSVHISKGCKPYVIIISFEL